MPKKGAHRILTKVVGTEALRELMNMFGTKEGTVRGILIDSINQNPFLSNGEWQSMC